MKITRNFCTYVCTNLLFPERTAIFYYAQCQLSYPEQYRNICSALVLLLPEVKVDILDAVAQ